MHMVGMGLFPLRIWTTTTLDRLAERRPLNKDPANMVGPANVRRRTYIADRGCSSEVQAIYPYVAQGADELGLQEGESIELTSGPTGGQNFGNGWWEGKSDKAFCVSYRGTHHVS
jgi:hypothetical protein